VCRGSQEWGRFGGGCATCVLERCFDKECFGGECATCASKGVSAEGVSAEGVRPVSSEGVLNLVGSASEDEC
jgi:hypothetical protein